MIRNLLAAVMISMFALVLAAPAQAQGECPRGCPIACCGGAAGGGGGGGSPGGGGGGGPPPPGAGPNVNTDDCPAACQIIPGGSGGGGLGFDPVRHKRGFSGQGILRNDGIRAELLPKIADLRQLRIEYVERKTRTYSTDGIDALIAAANDLMADLPPNPMDDFALRAAIMEIEAVASVAVSSRAPEQAITIGSDLRNLFQNLEGTYPQNLLIRGLRRAADERIPRIAQVAEQGGGGATASEGTTTLPDGSTQGGFPGGEEQGGSFGPF